MAGLSAPANSAAAGFHAGSRLPSHLFTPYFEAYTTDRPWQLSQESGARFLTLAFLQTPARGSCTLTWNGDPAAPVAWSTYGADIARIRAAGGDVIPSFGGYSADHGGTEIADSCTNVNSIAADYESVITTPGVTPPDMDVEPSPLNTPAGIPRRNQAIALTEQWAAANGIPLQIQYTIPV